MRNSLLILTLIILSFNSFCQKKESFKEFLRKMENMDFQISRIDFPIKVITVNEENFELDTIKISRDKWTKRNFLFYGFNKLNWDQYPQIYYRFDFDEVDSDQRVFVWHGYVSSDNLYYFERRKGKWFLILVKELDV